MTRLLLSILVSLAALTFATPTFAHEPELARPLDFDREIHKLDDTAYMVTVNQRDSLDFSAKGVKRITIDETRYVRAAAVNDKQRIILTPGAVGKGVVRVFFKDRDVITLIITVEK